MRLVAGDVVRQSTPSAAAAAGARPPSPRRTRRRRPPGRWCRTRCWSSGRWYRRPGGRRGWSARRHRPVTARASNMTIRRRPSRRGRPGRVRDRRTSRAARRSRRASVRSALASAMASGAADGGLRSRTVVARRGRSRRRRRLRAATATVVADAMAVRIFTPIGRHPSLARFRVTRWREDEAMADRDFDIVLFGATGFTGRPDRRLPRDARARRAALGDRRSQRRQARGRTPTARRCRDARGAASPTRPTPPRSPTSPAAHARRHHHGRSLPRSTAPRWSPPAPRPAPTTSTSPASPSSWTGCSSQHHQTAVRTGARIVHACGFDSIPHDLGAYYTVQQLPAEPADHPARRRPLRRHVLGRHVPLGARAVLPGQADEGGVRRSPSRRGQARRGPLLARRVAASRTATRSWATGCSRCRPSTRSSWRAAAPRSRRTARSSATRTGPAPRRCATPPAVPPLSAPSPPPPRSSRCATSCSARCRRATGPDEAKRDKSWFTVDFVGEGGGQTVRTRVSGGDPGYTETAKMLAESALCLAFDDNPADGRPGHARPRRWARTSSPASRRVASSSRRSSGAPGKSRTCDLSLRRRLLYPLSYWG